MVLAAKEGALVWIFNVLVNHWWQGLLDPSTAVRLIRSVGP